MGIFILAVTAMRMASGNTGTVHTGKVSPTPVRGVDSDVTLQFQYLGGEGFYSQAKMTITLPDAYDLSSLNPSAIATFATDNWEPTVLKDPVGPPYADITVEKITDSKPHKVVLTNVGTESFGCRTDAKVVVSNIGSPQTLGAQSFTIATTTGGMESITLIPVVIAEVAGVSAINECDKYEQDEKHCTKKRVINFCRSPGPGRRIYMKAEFDRYNPACAIDFGEDLSRNCTACCQDEGKSIPICPAVNCSLFDASGCDANSPGLISSPEDTGCSGGSCTKETCCQHSESAPSGSLSIFVLAALSIAVV